MALTRERALQRLGGEVGARRFVDCVEVASGEVHQLIFTLDTGERVAGLYQPPGGGGAGPAVLYCHAHGNRYDIGATELTEGRPALTAPYGPALRAAGYGVLCLDLPCFGGRAHLQEGAMSKALIWQGRTLFGQMLAEQVAGLDWLAAQPGIDPSRIGVMGISMGGTLAWWLAAVAPRVAAGVTMCCFADMGGLIATGAHDGHGPYMTVPGLLAEARTGQVAGLAAPRPMLHCVGLQDWSTPTPAFARARADLETCYDAAHAARQLAFHVEPDLGHQESPAMRARVLDFLGRIL